MTAGLSARHWNKGQLQDLVFFQRGFDITQAQQTLGPYPVISSSGVTSYHTAFKANGPGVVIGRKGTIGSIHFSEGDYWPHDTTLWSKDLRGNNPRFVYYYLHTMNLKRFDVGNSNPTLNRNHIHDLPVLIPPPAVQSRIADILSAYDDLIENSRRRMALLEEAARQLYREWFVRLRFPSHERTRITNGVAAGWEKVKVESLLLKVSRAKKVKKDGYSIAASIPCIDQGSDFIGGYTDDPDALIEQPLPLIVFGDHTRVLKFVNFPFACGADGTQLIYPNTPRVSPEYLYFALKGAEVSNYFYARHFKFLKELEVFIPLTFLVREFTNTVATCFEQIKVLRTQNEKLRAARDLLLPRLMSGEIPV